MSHHRDLALDDLARLVFDYAVGAVHLRNDVVVADAVEHVGHGMRRLTRGSDHLSLVGARSSFLLAATALVVLAAEIDRMDDEANSKPEPKK